MTTLSSFGFDGCFRRGDTGGASHAWAHAWAQARAQAQARPRLSLPRDTL